MKKALSTLQYPSGGRLSRIELIERNYNGCKGNPNWRKSMSTASRPPPINVKLTSSLCFSFQPNWFSTNYAYAVTPCPPGDLKRKKFYKKFCGRIRPFRKCSLYLFPLRLRINTAIAGTFTAADPDIRSSSLRQVILSLPFIQYLGDSRIDPVVSHPCRRYLPLFLLFNFGWNSKD